MKGLIERLTEITPQQPLKEVAKQAAIIFSDRGLSSTEVSGVRVEVVADPLRAALDEVKKRRSIKAVYVVGKYFGIADWSSRWMRGVRLWWELDIERRRRRNKEIPK